MCIMPELLYEIFIPTLLPLFGIVPDPINKFNSKKREVPHYLDKI